MSTLRLSLSALVTASILACSGDDGTSSGPPVVLETRVLDSTHIEAATTETRGLAGRSSSQSAAQLGGLGTIAPEALVGADIYRARAGQSTNFEYDIDSDGDADSIDVFLVSSGPTYLAWSEGGRCRLAYSWEDVGWYFDAECGQDGALVCRYEGGATACTLCDDRYCAECTADESDPRLVACREIVEPAPEPEPEPEVGVDIGDDAGDDVVDQPDATPDAPPEDVIEDSPVEDVVIDAPPTDTGSGGPCEASCMAAPGAVCCTTCGCAATDCLPACQRSGYTWDCEVQCCFNYDLLQCDEG